MNRDKYAIREIWLIVAFFGTLLQGFIYVLFGLTPLGIALSVLALVTYISMGRAEHRAYRRKRPKFD